MAVLSGASGREETISLEIAPVMPSLTGRRDAYKVAVQRNGKVVFSSVYDVHNWQLGHYWMYRIASGFQSVHRFVDVKQDFSLSSRHSVAPEKYNEPVYLEERIDWLIVVLWGRTEKERQKVFVEAFIQTNPDEISFEPSAFRHFMRIYLTTDIAASQRFGRELEDECQAAEDLRSKLGIPAREE